MAVADGAALYGGDFHRVPEFLHRFKRAFEAQGPHREGFRERD